jgi:acetyl esterase/lipase
MSIIRNPACDPRLILILVVAAIGGASSASAETFTLHDIPPPDQSATPLPLPTTSRSSVTLPEIWLQFGPHVSEHNVAIPTLTPFLPVRSTGNGTAVVIAPGGGFIILGMKLEGWEFARFLQSHGAAAFVLKYRLMPTAADVSTPPDMFAQMCEKLDHQR